MKLIQVGITLSDAEGNLPPEISTWQFNFKFDVNNDNCTQESISLLESAGIDFKKFCQDGIEPMGFAESLISSGLLLNENVTWITFHGVYDFAYFLKALTNQNLPQNEDLFLEDLELYFKNFYDIRCIISEFNWLKGSLSKISNYLAIKRVGASHQAGSDSLVTAKLYFKILEQFSDQIDLENERNCVFGLHDDDIVFKPSSNNNMEPQQKVQQALNINSASFAQMTSVQHGSMTGNHMQPSVGNGFNLAPNQNNMIYGPNMGAFYKPNSVMTNTLPNVSMGNTLPNVGVGNNLHYAALNQFYHQQQHPQQFEMVNKRFVPPNNNNGANMNYDEMMLSRLIFAQNNNNGVNNITYEEMQNRLFYMSNNSGVNNSNYDEFCYVSGDIASN